MQWQVAQNPIVKNFPNTMRIPGLFANKGIYPLPWQSTVKYRMSGTKTDPQ